MHPVIRDRRLKVGVVGCGRISHNHFGAIDIHSKDLQLASVCDIDERAGEEAGEKWNVPAYRDMKQMVEQEELDLIVLCTPSGLHPDQAVMAANHQINVVTEKPMATRWKDGIRMVRACDDNGVHLFVVKQNRKNSTLQLLKRAIDERRFGKIHMVGLNVYWSRPQSYYDSAKWRGTWELDGGAFMNQASHYVDLIDWLIGPVADIQAMTGTLGRNIEVEDTGVMNIRWRSGALGSMRVTMLAYPKNLEGSITVIGEKGTVRIGGVAVNEIQHWKFEDEKEYDNKIEEANYETQSVYGFGHPLYYKNVIDVFRGEASPETDGREGLRSLEILIAAYLSARDGKTVSLPLEY